MTKQDYELIADALKSAEPHSTHMEGERRQWLRDVYVVSAALAKANPRFDYIKFRARAIGSIIY